MIRRNTASIRAIPRQYLLEAAITSHPVHARTHDRLFERFGPLIDVGNAIKELGFPTRDAFNRAVQQGRVPFTVIRPEGRRTAFVRTEEVAKYLSGLAQSTEEKDTM